MSDTTNYQMCRGEGCEKMVPPGDHIYCQSCGMKVQLQATADDRRKLVSKCDALISENEILKEKIEELVNNNKKGDN